jgi:hypothetical protein
MMMLIFVAHAPVLLLESVDYFHLRVVGLGGGHEDLFEHLS